MEISLESLPIKMQIYVIRVIDTNCFTVFIFCENTLFNLCYLEYYLRSVLSYYEISENSGSGEGKLKILLHLKEDVKLKKLDLNS